MAILILLLLSSFRRVQASTYSYSYSSKHEEVTVTNKTVNFGEYIRSFDANIKINRDATVDIIEKIDYDFGAHYRHGIYRDIPVRKKNKNGKKYEITLSNISVTDSKGNPHPFSKMREGENVRLKIGDKHKTIAGLHSYVIRYKVLGAITYFSDHDELFWNVVGNKWKVPITRAQAIIKFPTNISTYEVKSACYTGAYGSKVSNCVINKDANYVSISTKRYLSRGENLSVVIGFPIDRIAHVEAKEVVDFGDTFIGKIVLLLVFISIVLAILIWYLIYPVKIAYDWFKRGRDPKAITGQVRAWFDPPKDPNNPKRFLTPAEVGVVIDEKADLRDVLATVIDLARRGYIKIDERKKKDFYLIKLKGADDKLLPFESMLISKFFGEKKEIRVKDKKLYTAIQKVTELIYAQVVKSRLFDKNPDKIRKKYYALLSASIFTFNPLMLISSLFFGLNMPRKTLSGVNAQNEAISLKNFLVSQERQLEFQANKQMMFEKLLPYAIVFGVEKIWLKRLKNLNLKQPDWYSTYDSNFNTVLLASSLGNSLSSFRSSATPTTSSSGFSSGFSSGGFSGGGFGGGGGGSW